jgi:hypothetical protein
LFLPPIKKNIKTTPYILPGSQEKYIMTTPLLLPLFVSSLNRFFIFLSINFAYTAQPVRAVEGLLDLPEDDDLHYYVGLSAESLLW